MAIGKEKKRTFCFSAARVKEENGDILNFPARGGPAFSLTALRSVFTSAGEISLGSLLRQVSQEG